MRYTLLFLLLFSVGCNEPAQSRQQDEPASVDLPTATLALDNANEGITQNRRNAITFAVEQASPAVVSVNVMEIQRVRYYDPFMDPWMERFFGGKRPRVQEREVHSLGSGFVISEDGYIVTNQHVTANATRITVAFMDGETMDAELVGMDEATDIALLKVSPEEPLHHLEFAKTGDPIPGEWAIALGNPFGLFEASEPTVTVGVVSGVGRDFQPQQNRIYRDMIQTDASINQGNSGGPLVNAMGEVIGVNTFIYSGSGGSIGLGFAVPAFKALNIVNELKTNGFVDRSYYTGLLGIDVNERIARALGMTEAKGFIIRDVEPDSPADQAGFQPYDVITSFEGDIVGSQQDLVARLIDYRVDDEVTFGVMRDDQQINLTLRLGRQPNQR